MVVRPRKSTQKHPGKTHCPSGPPPPPHGNRRRKTRWHSDWVHRPERPPSPEGPDSDWDAPAQALCASVISRWCGAQSLHFPVATQKVGISQHWTQLPPLLSRRPQAYPGPSSPSVSQKKLCKFIHRWESMKHCGVQCCGPIWWQKGAPNYCKRHCFWQINAKQLDLAQVAWLERAEAVPLVSWSHVRLGLWSCWGLG